MLRSLTGRATTPAILSASAVSDTRRLISACTAISAARHATQCWTTARLAPLLEYGRPISAPQSTPTTQPVSIPVPMAISPTRHLAPAISATLLAPPASTALLTAPAASQIITGLAGSAIALVPLSTSSIPMAPIAPDAALSATSVRVFIMCAPFARCLASSKRIFTIRLASAAVASEFVQMDIMERLTAEPVPIFAWLATPTAHFARAIPLPAHSASQASISSQARA